jgi:hypothetical protein
MTNTPPTNYQANKYHHAYVLVTALILVAVCIVVVLWRLQPPAPLGTNASPELFSAMRAIGELRQVLAVETPHIIGSSANNQVRERLISRLEALGYQPSVQDTMLCRSWETDHGMCARVKNVLIKLDGQMAGPAVLLMAHYDTQAGDLGAADDGSGVASLIETARVMKVHGPYRNPVIFLFTDGEDVGLMGARAFVTQHPWAQNVGAAICLDVGGVAGQSFMSRTGDDNAWLIEAFAASSRQPVANPLSQVVVNFMGNSSTSDLQEFIRSGIPGMDFSLYEHRSYYHSMQDRLANLDLGSLQHQGENGLNMASYLADMDISNPPTGNEVYIDLLGFTLLHWPAEWTLPLAVLAVVALLLAVVFGIARKQLRISAVLWGMLAGLSSIALTVLFGEGLTLAMKWVSGTPQPGYGYPLPTRLALWLLALLCAGMVATIFFRRSGTRGLGIGIWLIWAFLALFISIGLPSVTILFLVPTLLAAAVILIASFTPSRISDITHLAAFLVAAVGACLVWFPMAFRFEEFMSFDLSPAITVPLGLAFSSLLPLLVPPERMRNLRHYWIPAAFMLVVILAGIAVALPDYSETNPVRLPIVHLEDQDANRAILIAAAQPGSIPGSLKAHFDRVSQVFPWLPMKAYSTSTEITGQARAEADVLSDEISGGNRVVRLQVHVPSEAYRVELQVPIQNLTSVGVNGESLSVHPRTPDTSYYRLDFYGYGCNGLEVSLVFQGSDVGAMYLVTRYMGLPASADAIVNARPASAVPGLDGDETVVYSRIK